MENAGTVQTTHAHLTKRTGGRVVALVVCVSTACLTLGAIAAAVFASQTAQTPSPLVIPLIGAWAAFWPAVLGFAVGVPIWARTYRLWRCALAGAAPVLLGSLIASPIGNIGSASNVVIGVAEAAILALCLFAPVALQVREP